MRDSGCPLVARVCSATPCWALWDDEGGVEKWVAVRAEAFKAGLCLLSASWLGPQLVLLLGVDSIGSPFCVLFLRGLSC